MPLTKLDVERMQGGLAVVYVFVIQQELPMFVRLEVSSELLFDPACATAVGTMVVRDVVSAIQAKVREVTPCD